MLTIAVVQLEIALFDPETNLAKMEEYIKKAVQANVNLVVFPEDVVTGPIDGRKEFVDFEGRYVQHFQQLARQYAIDLVPGSIIEGVEERWYNTTYYIDSAGEIRGKYRKANLWHPERPYIVPGDSFPVFDTAYGKVGLLICWDLIFPEAFRAMVKQGVEMVICPSYWCFEDAGIGQQYDHDAEITGVNALCVARAFENEIVLVYANGATGEANNDKVSEHLIGRSQITVPFKGALQVLNHNQEAMFIQAVDSEILANAEFAYKIRSDLSQESA